MTLAALGQRTQRVPFGTGVTCPTFRYRPAIVAQTFDSLGLFYPGRVFLGVDSSEALNEAASGGGEAEAEEAAQLWRFVPIGFTDFIDEPDPRKIQQRAEQY